MIKLAMHFVPTLLASAASPIRPEPGARKYRTDPTIRFVCCSLVIRESARATANAPTTENTACVSSSSKMRDLVANQQKQLQSHAKSEDSESVSSGDSGFNDHHKTTAYASYNEFLSNYGKRSFESVKAPKAMVKSEIFINVNGAESVDGVSAGKSKGVEFVIQVTKPAIASKPTNVPKSPAAHKQVSIPKVFVQNEEQIVGIKQIPIKRLNNPNSSVRTLPLTQPIQPSNESSSNSIKPPLCNQNNSKLACISKQPSQPKNPIPLDSTKPPLIPQNSSKRIECTPTPPPLPSSLLNNPIPAQPSSQPPPPPPMPEFTNATPKLQIKTKSQQNQRMTTTKDSVIDELKRRNFNTIPRSWKHKTHDSTISFINREIEEVNKANNPNHFARNHLRKSASGENATFTRNNLMRSSAGKAQEQSESNNFWRSQLRSSHGRISNRVANEEAVLTTKVPVVNDNAAVDKNNPMVKRMVYSTLRNYIGAYNNQANHIISSKPKEMVVVDKGVTEQLNSIAMRGGLENLNGRVNPKSSTEN